MAAPPFGVKTYSKVVPKEPPPDSFFQDCNSDKLQHSIVKYQCDGAMFANWFMLHQNSRQSDKVKIDTIHCLLRGAYFIPSKETTALKSYGANESGDDENGEELAACRKVIIPKILLTNSVNSTRVYANDFDYEQDLEEQSRELRRKQRQNQPQPKPQPQFHFKVLPHVREEMERKRREKEEEEKMAAMGRKGRNAQMKENGRNGVKNESKKARKNRNMNNSSNNATPVESTAASTKGKKGKKKKKRQSSGESESDSFEYKRKPSRWIVPIVEAEATEVKAEEKGGSDSKSSEESTENANADGEALIEPATVNNNNNSNSNNTKDVNPDVGIEATLIPDAIPKVAHDSSVPPCQILIVAGDCLEAALTLQQITHLSTACLIMASSSQPGGGYRNGAGAQEENLFRRTNLLQCIDDPYGMNRNKSFSYPLPEFGGIYVHEAVCFRESESLGYRYYPEGPRLMSFIGVSAYSNPPLESRASEKEGEDEEEPLLAPNIARKIKRKLATIFRIARANHIRALVLSAFGCGAYGNPPRHMARLFREVMVEEGLLGSKQRSNGEGENKEECWLQYVVFAILDDRNAFQSHNPDGNLAGFEKEFRMRALTLLRMQVELMVLEEDRQKREMERQQEKENI